MTIEGVTRQPIAVSDISIYICLIDIRSKSKEQLNERRAGLSNQDTDTNSDELTKHVRANLIMCPKTLFRYIFWLSMRFCVIFRKQRFGGFCISGIGNMFDKSSVKNYRRPHKRGLKVQTGHQVHSHSPLKICWEFFLNIFFHSSKTVQTCWCSPPTFNPCPFWNNILIVQERFSLCLPF